jgi:hypothetical protein
MHTNARAQCPRAWRVGFLPWVTILHFSRHTHKIERVGMQPVGEGPESFAKMIAPEVNTITQVVERVGIKPK